MKSKLSFIVILFLISQNIFGQTLIFENFDSTPTGSIPDGWTLESSTYDWTVTDNNPYSGENSMGIFYSSTEIKDSWFFTPGIDLTENNVYYITFMLEAPGWGQDFPEALEVAVGNSAQILGMTEVIWSENTLFEPVYTKYILHYIPASSGTYFFGWHAFSQADVDYIMVDDVEIYQADEVDIAILNSNLPEAVVLGNSPNSSIEVINLGALSLSFDATVEVWELDNLHHVETVSVENLGAGETTTVYFSDFEPTTEGVFVYNYELIASGDANTDDNVLSTTINIIDGCEHQLVLTAPFLEMGWFGGSISVTMDGTSVLTNATLLAGDSTSCFFPASDESEIILNFDGEGELTDDCYWELYDGEGNLLVEGNGDGTNTPVIQNATANCPIVISNVEIKKDEITIMPNPSKGNVKISVTDEYLLEIIDVNGLVINKIKVDNETNIYIENSGIYILNFRQKDKVLSRKIIVE